MTDIGQSIMISMTVYAVGCVIISRLGINFSDRLTRSGSVNSFCGSKGSAGESFKTILAVFDIISAVAKSHTEYSFYKQTVPVCKQHCTSYIIVLYFSTYKLFVILHTICT